MKEKIAGYICGNVYIVKNNKEYKIEVLFFVPTTEMTDRSIGELIFYNYNDLVSFLNSDLTEEAKKEIKKLKQCKLKNSLFINYNALVFYSEKMGSGLNLEVESSLKKILQIACPCIAQQLEEIKKGNYETVGRKVLTTIDL